MRWRIGEFRSRKTLGLFFLSVFCLILLSPTPTIAQVEHDDLTGVKVAIYNGLGVMISSRIALTRMFEWMNASVVEVNATQILDDFLDEFDIFVIPGGSETTCNSELDSEGKEKVKDFVANGGSYFGICGGATFGAIYLGFFSGFMYPVGEPGNIIHMTTMNINQSSSGPDLTDLPENCSTMYYASQYFSPLAGTTLHTIATYEYNDRAGMVAFEYENGTVFLSSPHPEYEENDDRDDSASYDYLDDPDSEWDLLFRVSKWLVEASFIESTTTPTPTPTPAPLDLPLIATASSVITLIVLASVVTYRKRG